MNEITAAFNAAFAEMERGERPDTLTLPPHGYEMLKAALAFAGRDRRRIKREVNKAAKKRSKLWRTNGTPQIPAVPFYLRTPCS